MTTKTTKAKPGTAVAKAKIALPANYADVAAADVAALATKLAAPTGKTIGVTQSKEFKFPDGTKVSSFKGIIVDFVSMNAYYEGAYDSDNIVPPNCFAIGVVKNDDLEASPNSPDPQHQEGDPSCKQCWANAFKSAPNGKGKACKNSLKLAVLCADGEVRPLGISSTGLKEFGNYVRDVVQAFGVAPYAVMTEFSFDPKSDWSSVRCGNAVKLNDAQIAEVLMKRDDAHAMIATEPDCTEFEEKVVALRDKPAKGKTAAKPLPAAKGKPAARARA